MDQDLTKNAFKKFMRRRGLSREKGPATSATPGGGSDDNDVKMTENVSQQQQQQPRHSNMHQSQHRLSSSSHYRSSAQFPRPSSLHIQPDQYSQQYQRMSSTYNRSRESAHRMYGSSSHIDNLKRMQTSSESAADSTSSVQSPSRRQKKTQIQDNPMSSPSLSQSIGNTMNQNKKVYKCEYCSLTFGRKHHKERHVDNIHRHVSYFTICLFVNNVNWALIHISVHQ